MEFEYFYKINFIATMNQFLRLSQNPNGTLV